MECSKIYELENGSARFAGALGRAGADSTRLTQLAHLLKFTHNPLPTKLSALPHKIVGTLPTKMSEGIIQEYNIPPISPVDGGNRPP